jgi:hypothetical protein
LATNAARRSEADIEALASFLTEDILASARPIDDMGGLGIHITVREALDAAESAIERRLQNRPRAEAKTRQALGITYLTLYEVNTAIRHLTRSWELFRQECGENDIETLFAQSELARAYLRNDQLQDS